MVAVQVGDCHVGGQSLSKLLERMACHRMDVGTTQSCVIEHASKGYPVNLHWNGEACVLGCQYLEPTFPCRAQTVVVAQEAILSKASTLH